MGIAQKGMEDLTEIAIARSKSVLLLSTLAIPSALLPLSETSRPEIQPAIKYAKKPLYFFAYLYRFLFAFCYLETQ